MSTLNTFGFNVRRKRNYTPQTPLPSKQEKSTTATPILAFAAPTPAIVTKPKVNKTPTKSKPNKKQLSKDPKQTTLLPFFTSITPSPTTTIGSSLSTSPLPPTIANSTTVIPPSSTQENTEEKNEICLVKRHVTMNEILPILMDAFGTQQQPPTILLQVKPSKAMRPIQPTEVMDFTIENATPQSLLRRRRSCHDDDETETLRTAFSKSLCLVPMKKRLCGNPSNQRHQQQQQRMISGLFENGHEQQLDTLEDEFDDQHDNNEIHTVRQCLSPGQMNSLLLDIANEYLVFENNTWCASYMGSL